ncbi:hypothetical protein M5X04_12745 [Paenibacillus alvei]|uniref:Uncharacterized protein n=1 Tax=Paenibacillus alvei TaxID=44250 RepID=A0ABT4E990_PAEAL|nr:hypothetical protein [Paenibacillus alvei]MCY9530185.1 hypothetical protein [Paenibacillus alvei]
MQDTNSLQDVVGSTIFITYLVEADDVTDPDTINWMNRFGDKIVAQHKDVEEVTSLPQLLLQMTGNHDFSSDKEQLENLIKQMPPTLLKSVVSANKQYATMQFKVNQELSSAQQLELMNNITQQIDASDGIQVSPVGTQVMMLRGIDNVSANHNVITITSRRTRNRVRAAFIFRFEGTKHIGVIAALLTPNNTSSLVFHSIFNGSCNFGACEPFRDPKSQINS